MRLFVSVGLLLLAAAPARTFQLPDLASKVAQVNIGVSTLDDVVRIFGEPQRYLWGNQTFPKDKLPSVFLADYGGGFSVLMAGGRVNELRFEQPGFLFLDKVQVGSSLEAVFGALGQPRAVVRGEPLPSAPKDGVLYADIGGRVGYCYLVRAVQGVRLFFWNNQVSALYLSAKRTVGRFNPDSTDPWQVDLRGLDLSPLDLRDRFHDLLHASFDDGTAWPPAEMLPEGFDPRAIPELGRNPGLGMRRMHRAGITGHGVGIALLDSPLLAGHPEYADRLRAYEQLGLPAGAEPQMHGLAVASFAVGATAGVAPGADLYYIATDISDYRLLARAIRRVLEINRDLPDNRKIRVISASIGWVAQPGSEEALAAAHEAKAAGMLVVCSSVEQIHGLKFHGLGRSVADDPEEFASYAPGHFWAKSWYEGQRFTDRLLVPMDARTAASPGGVGEYVFYRHGGWSWAIPYVAGAYALAAQVDPAITPERFWAVALESGKTIELQLGEEKIPFGPILDPVSLIGRLQESLERAVGTSSRARPVSWSRR